MKTLLKDGTIITMNSRKEIWHNADLLIEGDRIKTLSQCVADRGNDVDDVVDCKGKIIIPGSLAPILTLPECFREVVGRDFFRVLVAKIGGDRKVFNPSPDDIYVIHSAACIRAYPARRDNGSEYVHRTFEGS
jgi:hypothetical protein